MHSFFLDTSFLIALEFQYDQYHRQAREMWIDISTKNPKLVTTSFIFNEIVTHINTRKHHQVALKIGDNLLRSASIKLVHVDEALFTEGWKYLQTR